MLIGIIFVICLTLFLIVTKIKSKYTIAFVMVFLSIFLLMLSLMLYITKMSPYRYFFQVEFILYQFIGDIKISFFDIKWFLNIAVVLFEAAMSMFVISDINLRGESTKKKNYMITFFVMSLVYFVLNLNSLAEYVYIVYYANEYLGNVLRSLVFSYNIFYMFFFSILTYIVIIRNYKTTVLFFKKNHLKVMFTVVVMLQFLFFFMLYLTPLKFFISNADLYDYTSINLMYDGRLYLYVPLIVCIVLVLVIYISIRYKIFDEWLFLKRRKINHNFKILLSDMRHLFHTYKNVMVSIGFLQQKAVDNYGKDKGMDALLMIKENVDDFSNQATRFFEICNGRLELKFDAVSIVDCLEHVLRKIEFGNITVTKEYDDNGYTIYGDFDYLQEMFTNIVGNSVEAHNFTDQIDKRISIKVWVEKTFICVSVRDNGSGIPKNVLSKIFKPFCSTKNSFKNWGLGLSYAKTVVDAHLGYIDVATKVGEYTEFQVILPID